MHYETANKTIEKVMPNPPVKFYTLIAKPKRRKYKKVKNINIDLSNRIIVLMNCTYSSMCRKSIWVGKVKMKRIKVCIL
jgi:hypothetical protein